MSAIVKSFMGIFFFALIVFLGIGIVSYQTDVSRAQDYKQNVVEELQNSDFSPSVVNACIAEGVKQGYGVSVDVSCSDGSRKTYTKEAPAVDTSDVSAAYITVVYKCRLPFLGVETSNTLRGFAR